MRSPTPGWVMPQEDIPSMLQMIEAKIASSQIEVRHRDSLIRLKHILEQDLERTRASKAAGMASHENKRVS